MADWVTISSLATAGGTLVLAVATFSSVKSANRSARVAELALLVGQRPLLIPSHEDDLPERVRFGDEVILTVPGHGGALHFEEGGLYMAIALRNGGNGLAVIHGWRAGPRQAQMLAGEASAMEMPAVRDFRRQQRDLYIPAGETGFWQGAIRDREDSEFAALKAAIRERQPVMIDILYSDHEGGQRAITRFTVFDWPEVEGERAEALRYWNVDRDDPR
jgi:hypothetical protein